MSVIRLSAIAQTLYAPLMDGSIDLYPYSRTRLSGQLEKLAKPLIADRNSQLYHYLSQRILPHSRHLNDDTPVVVMVHGFLFDPRHAIGPLPDSTDNPHGRLYHLQTTDEEYDIRHHAASWPLGLGMGDDEKDGLAIAFGWHSQPGVASSLIKHRRNFYAQAYHIAEDAAWLLANTLILLQQLLPGKAIDCFCHSLGSRVIVRALTLMAQLCPDHLKNIDRVLFLGGAEYVVEAQLMMRKLALANKNQISFYNIVSRENDVLDKLGEHFGARTFGNTQVIGHNGLDVEHPGEQWIDLQIDSLKLQQWMETHHSLHISGDRPDNIWDHWYYYTYRENMKLYRNILRDRESWNIPTLRAAHIPDRVSKRWSIFGD